MRLRQRQRRLKDGWWTTGCRLVREASQSQGDWKVEHLLAAHVAGAVALDAEPLDGAGPVRQGQLALAAALQLQHRLLGQGYHADAAHRLLGRDVLFFLLLFFFLLFSSGGGGLI